MLFTCDYSGWEGDVCGFDGFLSWGFWFRVMEMLDNLFLGWIGCELNGGVLTTTPISQKYLPTYSLRCVP